jgi:hypothetical protein
MTDIENGPESATDRDQNISADNADTAAPSRGAPLDGQLLQRRDRRRADLMTLGGLARENARQLRRYLSGAISAKAYNAHVRFSYLQLATLRTLHGVELIERQQAATAIDVKPAIAAPTLGDWYRSLAEFRASRENATDGEPSP